MADQMIFKRCEIKYMLDITQAELLKNQMKQYMTADEHGMSTICSLYFDTPDYLLIQRSMEHPVYKEKLRLRSYGMADKDTTVFVELKKKYKSVVYKRRLIAAQAQAMECLQKGEHLPVNSQIADEIQYFCSYYGKLFPTVFLSYEREAYYCRDGGDFRVTFDENILARREGFSFREGIYGTPLIERGSTLMEVKTSGGLPLWLVRCLSEHAIFKTSFSKYGTAYENMIRADAAACEGGILHA